MAIIVVGGSAKGVGKTTLVCGIIAAFTEFRWTAVKITSDVHGNLPPVYEEKSAGPGTDTARYLAAGAERAFLLTVPSVRVLPEYLEEFWPRIGPRTNLVFESNRVASLLSADICVLVQGDPRDGEPKASFPGAAQVGDAVVVRGNDDLMVASAMEIKGGPGGLVFNLKSFDKISEEMKQWMSGRMLDRAASSQEPVD